MKQELESIIKNQDVEGLQELIEKGLDVSEIKLVEVFRTIFNNHRKTLKDFYKKEKKKDNKSTLKLSTDKYKYFLNYTQSLEKYLNTKFIKIFLKNYADAEYTIYSKTEANISSYATGKPVKKEKIKLSCFQFSLWFYDKELIKYFIDQDSNVNQEIAALMKWGDDLFQSNALLYAYYHNDIDMMKFLMARGAKIDFDIDIDGDEEQYEANKLLLESGVNTNRFISSERQTTAIKGFSLLFKNKHHHNRLVKINKNYTQDIIKEIKLFIEYSADVNTGCPINDILDSDYLEKNEIWELFNLFLNAGLDVNCKDKKGNTPLIVLVKSDVLIAYDFRDILGDDKYAYDIMQYRIINTLIDHGADINAENNMGMTALMLASYHGQDYMVKLLLEHGADINLKSEMTAFDLATNDKIKEMINDTRNHTPQKLVKILTSFSSIDKPIKFTTHVWDFGNLREEYKDFEGFMSGVKKQFDNFKDELEELSPNLYKKIHTFLLETNPENDYSWCSKAKINIGWSSLEGLKEHCNSGKKPCEFELPESLSKSIELPTGAEVTTFGEVIDLFKQEIEIRRDFKNLSKVFRKIGKRLGADFTFNTQKIDRQFYTDTEKLTITLDKIFDGIKKHNDHKSVEVIANEFDDGTIELKITQINSLSTLNANDLFKEAEDGDFADIKANLTNLCDWSVEGSFEDASFRINYLKSNNVKDIVELDNKPAGFTHILRFYKR